MAVKKSCACGALPRQMKHPPKKFPACGGLSKTPKPGSPTYGGLTRQQDTQGRDTKTPDHKAEPPSTSQLKHKAPRPPSRAKQPRPTQHKAKDCSGNQSTCPKAHTHNTLFRTYHRSQSNIHKACPKVTNIHQIIYLQSYNYKSLHLSNYSTSLSTYTYQPTHSQISKTCPKAAHPSLYAAAHSPSPSWDEWAFSFLLGQHMRQPLLLCE